MATSPLMRSAKSVVVFDFETTGLSPNNGDRTIEVGAVLIENGRITDRFQRLMNPGIRIPVFVENLTGITNHMIAEADSCPAVFKEFSEFVAGHNLVAHNASFDERFLRAEYKRAKIEISHSIGCSLLLSRRILPMASSHSLSNLALQYQLPSDGNYHRALADAEVTAHLWLMLCDRLQAKQGFNFIPFSLMLELSKTARHKLSRVYDEWHQQSSPIPAI
jgi:DNA polymerase-3 subunit epsilon